MLHTEYQTRSSITINALFLARIASWRSAEVLFFFLIISFKLTKCSFKISDKIDNDVNNTDIISISFLKWKAAISLKICETSFSFFIIFISFSRLKEVYIHLILYSIRFFPHIHFIPGWNHLHFIPGWDSSVNRIYFIPGRNSSRDEIWSRLRVNLLNLSGFDLTSAYTNQTGWRVERTIRFARPHLFEMRMSTAVERRMTTAFERRMSTVIES